MVPMTISHRRSELAAIPRSASPVSSTLPDISCTGDHYAGAVKRWWNAKRGEVTLPASILVPTRPKALRTRRSCHWANGQGSLAPLLWFALLARPDGSSRGWACAEREYSCTAILPLHYQECLHRGRPEPRGKP